MGLIFLYYFCVRQRLKPLRIHTHSPPPPMWDERYESVICCAGFLPLAQLVNRGLPLMDAATLTALVDRWHPETHMFHLPSGEIMVTLQDIAMILCLPIDGTPVCGMVSPAGWRDSVGQVIGLRLSDVPTDQKDRKMTGMHSGWLTAHFDTCPEGAEDTVIQRYVWSCA
jgi:hypothetical protein